MAAGLHREGVESQFGEPYPEGAEADKEDYTQGKR